MPRYRKLHAKTVESFDFNEMPDDFTRLFWVLLPLGLSREGTLPATPALVRSKIFPLREDITFDMIRVALNWFAERDMIRFYEAEGHQYLWAVNFAHYQGNTVKESDSNYPPPPEQWSNDTESTPDLLLTNSGPTPARVPRNGMELNRIEKGGDLALNLLDEVQGKVAENQISENKEKAE